jgi:DNA (cytosine-5)-methyltransferase 1
VNGLALCAGIGGIELGLKLALGDSYRTVCYVEREAYCAEVLASRMEEGYLDMAPIWDDIGSFKGFSFRGDVDIVSSGFPCQPFSGAGKRLGEADERHLWPAIARILDECRPAFVFLENVRISAFKAPYRDLRDLGFWVSNPYSITAAEMGAPHIRHRVFALAYRTGLRDERWWSIWKGRQSEEVSKYAWNQKPGISRVDDGVSNRMDRNRALGNAVVPIVAAKAFVELMKQAKE